jgi:A/G-specific adenine glycosylase
MAFRRGVTAANEPACALHMFSERIITWQRAHGRHDLPWQGTRDPYRIWLSEVMLQQTQVASVIPYYLRFVDRFRDVEVLAAATSDDVMSAWAGLGYYSRARNLHRCAQVIATEHAGQFPRSAAELARLPGIGRSTAAAIAAFAFGERAAILDGNVKRVLARHFAVAGHPGVSSVERALWGIAEQQLPHADIEAYTQGLMDLGSSICTRRRPQCAQCPLQASCVARREGRIAELPAPRPPKARPLRAATLALIGDASGAVLLERRAPAGIWGGLLSLPEFEADLSDTELARQIERRFALAASVIERLEPVRHEFSHYSFVMQPRVLQAMRVVSVAEAAGVEWVAPDRFRHAPLPAPIRRLLVERNGEDATT